VVWSELEIILGVESEAANSLTDIAIIFFQKSKNVHTNQYSKISFYNHNSNFA
jgi:hypothetical protein